MRMTNGAARGHSAVATLVVVLAVMAWIAAIAPAQAASAKAETKSDPPASALPGYWAETSCSEGNEIVFAESWRPNWENAYPATAGHIVTCLVIGGSILLRDEGSVDSQPLSGPQEIYEAPPVSTIAGGVLKVHVSTPHSTAFINTNNNTEPINYTLNCSTQCASGKDETLSISHPGGWLMYAGVLCNPVSGESTCPSGINGELGITSATIMLRNESTPTATGFGGTLLSEHASGDATVTFTAQDKSGPGVYRVSAQIDGHQVASITPNLDEGRCLAYGSLYGALNFRYRQPCPQATAASLEVPTATIADGRHQLKLEVEDAAGNSATVYEHAIAVLNHPATAETPSASTAPVEAPLPPDRGPCNGSPCAEAGRIALTRQPTTFSRSLGRSPVTLSGRLTDPTGAPIKGAQVQLFQQVLGSASKTHIANATTRPDGTWTLKTAAGPSRTLQLAYYSHTLDTIPATTLDLHENVQAVASMRAPHRARLGHTIVFDGQLVGGYVPPGGESIQMEIRYGGRWRTIEVLPTNSHGRWAYKYVFSLGAGTSYEFRAATVPNGGYPFLSAHSKPVRVSVVR